MAKIPGGFNTDGQQEMGFGLLPKGDYKVQIVESEYKPTSSGKGHLLMLKREIMEGQFKGCFIYRNLNLDNPNPVAVEIANKEFTSTCKACGKVSVEDSEELHFIPHTISLAVKQHKEKADEQVVTDIKPLEGLKEVILQDDSSDTKSAEPAKKKRPVFDDD